MHAPIPAPRLVANGGRAAWRFADGTTLPAVTGGDGPADQPELVIPTDLTSDDVTDGRLTELEEAAIAAITAIEGQESFTSDDVTTVTNLAAGVQAIRAERQRRAAEDQRIRDEVAAQVAAIRNEGGDTPAETPDGGNGEPGTDAPATPEPTAPESPEPVQPEPVEATAPAAEPVAASARPPIRVPAVPARRGLNVPVTDIVAAAPNAGPTGAERVSPEMVLTAAADVPGLNNGQRLTSLDELATAMSARAQSLGVTAGNPHPVNLASIRRHNDVVVDETTSTEDVRDALEGLVAAGRTRQGLEAIVAAGGWCAPSEIRYDFFNVAEVAGQWDVPTIGIRRGGIRWPQSFSLADFFAMSSTPPSGIPSNATMPWLWTEADDIAATTGAPTKLCLRPPCPDFDEVRLAAYGICVLAGNLTEDAYPELIRDFIRTLMVAHARIMNRRHLALAVANAGTVAVPGIVEGQVGGTVAPILGAAELQAVDTRTKFGLSDTAPIEAVFPSWLRSVMRSDLAKRNGWNDLAVTDAYLMSLFDARNIRTQWVQDWQTLPGEAGPANTLGAITPPTSWPSTVQFLTYIPGTYFLGRGMNLNLGVIRDSVLNETNDHTAAWSEEATAVGMFGHESRLVTVDICPNGGTGGQATLAQSNCGV